MAEIETAVLQKDYKLLQQLSQDLLNQSTDETISQQARYYLGISHIELREYDQARAIFGEMIKKKDLPPELKDKAYLGLFDAYYLDEQYTRAKETIHKLLKASPRSEFLSLVYLKAARVNLKLTRWQEAQDYLQKILHQFPESFEAYTAKQLLEEEQYFAVQVGAFMDRHLAESVVFDLKLKNEYAYIVETVDRENLTFYRVRVGQTARLNEARKLEMKLAEQGYPTQIYP